MDSTVVTAAAADTNEADEIHQQLPSAVNGEHASPEDHELSPKLSSDKEQRRQELSNKSIEQQTPNHNPTKKNYNDYVNHVYEGTNGKANGSEADEEAEEVKPLLKSIVKSPSGNMRPTLPINGMRSKNKRLSWQASDPSRHHVQFNQHSTSGNQNQEGNENNTQSTSLDSSDEPGTNNEECPSSPITSSGSSSSSSDDEDDEFSEIKAPDGGWGWVRNIIILRRPLLTHAIRRFRLSCSPAL